MKISFIVTSFNIARYIEECLESLHGCVAPGDEVIVVDDGSTDETVELIERFFARNGFGQYVGVNLILLGANTPGGVGIPANIGMNEATGEAVFFVDGDDWIIREGFRACRDAFERSRPDILIGNYGEYNDQAETSRAPADQDRWSVAVPADLAGQRLLALSMIAVPWRKFYRRDFLEQHRLRFPEGNFFYEDNPFHWDVCLHAGAIRFANHVLCQHRVNRPGQTMGANGIELAAFFTHFDTITANLNRVGQPADSAERLASVEWLLGNMAWHLDRLHRSALWDYAEVAGPVIRSIDAALFAKALAGRFKGSTVARAATQLRRADAHIVAGFWVADRTLNLSEQINRKVDALARQLGAAQDDISRTLDASNRAAMHGHTLVAVQEFEAMSRLFGAARADG